MKKLLIIAILMLAMVFTVAACTTEPDNTDTTDGETTVAAVDETTAEPTPVETDPVETDPVETEPVETEPVETEPVETEAPKAAYPELDNLIAYLPLDKKIGNKIDSDIVPQKGNSPAFDAGYKSAALSTSTSGYLTLGENWKPGTDSFSASMWVKGVSTSGQVCLLANMAWGPEDTGFVFVWYQQDDNIRGVFNFNGVKKTYNFNVPDDYLDRWMYVTIVVDRENGQVKMSFDFNDFIVYDLDPTICADGVKFDSYNDMENLEGYRAVAIGNDGVGARDVPGGNMIDEVLVFNDALTMEELALIQAYYGFEKPAPVEPEQPAEPEVTAPRLAVDKTTYAVGESIMVTAVGSGTDWVGINTKERADNGEGSAFWWYIESVSGQAFDILAVVDGSGNTCTLPAGVYTIRLVANDADFGSRDNWIYEIEITIE